MGILDSRGISHRLQQRHGGALTPEAVHRPVQIRRQAGCEQVKHEADHSLGLVAGHTHIGNHNGGDSTGQCAGQNGKNERTGQLIDVHGGKCANYHIAFETDVHDTSPFSDGLADCRQQDRNPLTQS